jgi:hypothetical protein
VLPGPWVVSLIQPGEVHRMPYMNAQAVSRGPGNSGGEGLAPWLTVSSPFGLAQALSRLKSLTLPVSHHALCCLDGSEAV